MNRAILIVWGAGLAGALPATLMVLKSVALVLRALRDILILAERTREAANGVAANLEAVSRLPAAAPPARGLRDAAGAMAAFGASLDDTLRAAAGAATPRGG